MSTTPSPLRRLRSDERGFALTEVLVTCSLGILVLFIPLFLIQTIFSSADQVSSRVSAASRAQTTLAPLLRDLRHATSATITSGGGSASATMQVPVRTAAGALAPTSVRVVWTCTAGASCTRQVGTGPAVTHIPYVADATFNATSAAGVTTLPATNPSYVGVTLRARVVSDASRSGKNAAQATELTIADGVTLRNFA